MAAQLKTVDSLPPPPQWVLDLNMETPKKPKVSGIPDPPGYAAVAGRSKVRGENIIGSFMSANEV